MENKENEKALTLKDLEKFTENILMPVLDGIMNRLEKLEVGQKEMKGDIVEMRGDMAEMKSDNKKEHEEMRKDILDGQDTLAKLIEDKDESDVMDMASRRRFEEKVDDHEGRIKSVEERLNVPAGV